MPDETNFNEASNHVKKMVMWMKNRWNVMLIGRHGVGKTSMILNALQIAEFDDDEWLYFSGATLDPWVDFVGVPKEKQTEDGKSYLELVRPEAFLNDKVKFIFIDEYNRTHKKVRNAAMELIQFKSINGKKFPNLQMVWTAINPFEDEELDMEYDVEQLDPAQQDRFQIQYEIPYKPDKAFFQSKFGAEAADVAIEWWNNLKRDGKNQHHLVSPRRLEYALDVHMANGDIADVLPDGINSSMLKKKLTTVPATTELIRLVNEENTEGVRTHLADENNYDLVIKGLIRDQRLREFCLPLLQEEKISQLIAENNVVKDHALKNYADEDLPFKGILDEIVKAKMNKNLVREIESYKGRLKHRNKKKG